MAGIINGKVSASSIGSGAVRLTTLPTPIKYLWIEASSENVANVYIGGSTASNDTAPVLAKGIPREFTFRHDVRESPGDLADFYVHSGVYNELDPDAVYYLAITI